MCAERGITKAATDVDHIVALAAARPITWITCARLRPKAT
jgi:hypothetical protein